MLSLRRWLLALIVLVGVLAVAIPALWVVMALVEGGIQYLIFIAPLWAQPYVAFVAVLSLMVGLPALAIILDARMKNNSNPSSPAEL